MDTKTKSIEIAWVERLNSSEHDIKYEQLIDGKPKHIRSYLELSFWGNRTLREGESFQSSMRVRALGILPPFPIWPRRISNVDGQLVTTFFRRPRRKN